MMGENNRMAKGFVICILTRDIPFTVWHVNSVEITFNWDITYASGLIDGCVFEPSGCTCGKL